MHGFSRGFTNVSRPQFGRLFANRPGEVPPEFDIADAKIKELHSLLSDMQKFVKKFLKTLLAYSGANMTLANQFQEFSNYLLDNGELGALITPVLRKLFDAAVACSVSHSDLREKVDSGVINNTELYIQESIIPAREAKRLWQKAKSELDQAKQKLDAFLKQSQGTNFEASKLLFAQTQVVLARRREQERFEAACDALGDTLWSRDYRFFLHVAEMMMELHDYFLNIYSHYYAMGDFFKEMRDAMEAKRQRFNLRKDELQQARDRAEEEEFHNRYSPLIELLSAEDLALVSAISMTAGAEQDEILTSVIKILDAHKRSMPIIKLAITNEVAATNSETTLFRGNSTSTKLMSQFTRITGLKYLRIIRPLIAEVSKVPSGFEVDPQKLQPGEDVHANMARLKKICQRFFDVITRSAEMCPLPFKEISKKLHDDVNIRFPDAGRTAVAGFIFLRFFCPSIMTPEVNGLTQGLSESAVHDKSFRRSLTLISKVIQNTANGVKFGSKEGYMEPMNDIIEYNLPHVQKFLFDITNFKSESDYDPICTLEEARGYELPKLHLKIVQNLEKIAKIFVNNKQEEVIEVLLVVLGELGDVDVQVQRDKPVKAKSSLPRFGLKSKDSH